MMPIYASILKKARGVKFVYEDSIRKIKVHIAIRRRTQLPNATSYIGWVGFDNLGDEILFEAHKQLFSRLNFVIYAPSRFVNKKFQADNASLYKLGFLGGGTLINRSDYWLGQVSDLLDQNVPMHCFGTGVASPDFWNKDSEGLIKKEWVNALNRFEFVGIRGPLSQKYLVDSGVNNTVVIGDTALALAPKILPPRSVHNKIGINFGLLEGNMIWGSPDKYFREMVKFIHVLIGMGFDVVLLPVWKDDIQSNIELLDKVNSAKCYLESNAYRSLEAYSKEVVDCQYFIGQKLHATIIATSHRVPSIMLAYRPKCVDYMESIKMSEYTIKTSDFTSQDIGLIFERLVVAHEKVRRRLDKEVLRYSNLQHKYAREITNKLLFLE